MSKPWYRSRIIWLNLIVAGGTAATSLAGFLPAWAMGTITVVVALANVVLRYDTEKGIE